MCSEREIIVEYEEIDSHNLLIFVHGFPSHKDSRQNKEAAARIRQSGIASTLRYSSSRNWDVWNAAKAPSDLLLMIEAFSTKSYEEEVDELKSVITNAQRNLKPKKLYLSGTSYGAGLASLVAQDAQVQKLLLSCPQTSPEGRESFGCYIGFPPKQSFIDAMKRFMGNLCIIHSIDDTVVPYASSLALYAAATTAASKELVPILGSDHLFSGENLSLYTRKHLEFFGD